MGKVEERWKETESRLSVKVETLEQVKKNISKRIRSTKKRIEEGRNLLMELEVWRDKDLNKYRLDFLNQRGAPFIHFDWISDGKHRGQIETNREHSYKEIIPSIQDPLFRKLAAIQIYSEAPFWDDGLTRATSGNIQKLLTRKMTEQNYWELLNETSINIILSTTTERDFWFLRKIDRKSLNHWGEETKSDASKDPRGVPFDDYLEGVRSNELEEMRQYFTERFSSDKYAPQKEGRER
jgi:hypothetical protein